METDAKYARHYLCYVINTYMLTDDGIYVYTRFLFLLTAGRAFCAIQFGSREISAANKYS